MNKFMKILYILSWIPVAIIKIALALLGLFVIPIALQFERWPKLFWLWNNQEGVPQWWVNNSQNKWYTRYWHRWWWYAIRNPVNNAQFIFEDPGNVHVATNWFVDYGMEAPNLIKTGQRMAYMWRWSGPFASYRRVWLTDAEMQGTVNINRKLVATKYSEIWFGWKVGSTVPGMGFTMQVRLNRKIGT